MMRQPQRSTLFPYTTLFRSIIERYRALKLSNRDLLVSVLLGGRSSRNVRYGRQKPYSQDSRRLVRRLAKRSEEHTSELQSRENLVCRLLLEKKKRHECNSKI